MKVPVNFDSIVRNSYWLLINITGQLQRTIPLLYVTQTQSFLKPDKVPIYLLENILTRTNDLSYGYIRGVRHITKDGKADHPTEDRIERVD